jgi:hypothetical protein
MILVMHKGMGQKRGRRAMAMVHTLSLLALVLLFAFSLAGSSLSQLNLSSRYSQRTQADASAKAAMTEFILRVRQANLARDVTTLPPPVLNLFREPGQDQLLANEAPLFTSARLLLDKCTDNSSNPQPAKSYFDSDSGRSVPPFAVSLVYEVNIGSHHYVYESLLQQRWPYALTAPGPIMVAGRIGADPGATSPIPENFWSAPSVIDGRVLALQTSVRLDGETPDGEFPAGPRFGMQRDPARVSLKVYEALYPFAASGGLSGTSYLGESGGFYTTLRPTNDTRLTVGGALRLYPLSLEGREWETVPISQHTLGALIGSGVDFCENNPSRGWTTPGSTQPNVVVGDGSTLKGRIRKNYRFAGLSPDTAVSRSRMAGLFSKSDTSSWQPINIDSRHVGIHLLRSGTESSTVTEHYYQVPSGMCVHTGDLVPEGSSRYESSSPATVPLQGSLHLQDVSLAVDGDLILNNYLLKGSNATLVVAGTLTLDGGYLDSGDSGLVIFCRRLIMKAQGQLNGLIVAEKGAAIYGGGATSGEAPSEPGLVIKGGLLVGGADLLIQPDLSIPGPPGEPPRPIVSDNQLLPLEMRGLTVVSARIEYEPRYLRGLNAFASHEVVATQLRQ